MDDNLFENIEIVEKKKPKRKLTEAQLQNLKRGREKMAEKRRLLKEEKLKGLKVVKEDKKAVKENIKIKIEQKKVRKRKTKNQAEELAHLDLIREKRRIEAEEDLRREQGEKLSRFADLRSKWVQKTETEAQYEELTSVLDTIPEETILDDKQLETTLLDLMERYKNGEREEEEEDSGEEEEESL